jgi:hypothetical protein
MAGSPDVALDLLRQAMAAREVGDVGVARAVFA